MNNMKLEAIDLVIYNEIKNEAIKRGFDQNKKYSVNEATALYKLVTKCCVSGILDFVNKLNLPENTTLTLNDIARLTVNQEGSNIFCKAVGIVQLDNDYKNVEGKIIIPDIKTNEREFDHDASFIDTIIKQKNGSGKVTNFIVSNDYKLDIKVDTNTDLELSNIKTGGNIDFKISTATLVYAGAGFKSLVTKEHAIRTSGNIKISIATCKWAEFGICANLIEVNQISTCDNFHLHAIEFKEIIFYQSTCNHTYIYIPRGTKFKLINDVSSSKIECNGNFIDENAERLIHIKQVSTGVVHIREEDVL